MREMSGQSNGGSGSNPSLSSPVTVENPTVFESVGGAEGPEFTPHSQKGEAGPPPSGTGETPAQPRSCTEAWTDADGGPVSCGALLGAAAARCSVCQGSRCYEHCGSVDHFEGSTLYCEGGANGFRWRVTRTREGGEFNMGHYVGHLQSERTGRVVARGIEGDDPEEVLREVLDLVPRGAPDRLPAPATPARTPAGNCPRVKGIAAQVAAAAKLVADCNRCGCDACVYIVGAFNKAAIAASAKAVRS